MTVGVAINLKLNNRDIAFAMNADPGYAADHNTMQGLEKDGCCEPEVANVMARVLYEGDHAIDIGANIGFFSLLMARLVGPSGRVTAFEPAPSTFVKLKENLKLNRMTQVVPKQEALSHRIGSQKLFLEMDSGSNALVRTPNTVGSVKVATNMLAAFDPPRLIKMDAEGAEMDIMLGGAGQIAPVNTPYIISELNEESLARFKTTPMELRGWMATRGYDTFILSINEFIPALLPPKTTIASNRLNVNVLFSTIEHVGAAWPEIVL